MAPDVSDQGREGDDDEYDEEADSDFDVSGSDNGSISSDEENNNQSDAVKRSKKSATSVSLIEKLDSGDEATIQKQKKVHKKTTPGQNGDARGENDGWRAKTRSMRAQEKEEKKQAKWFSKKVVTVDIDRIWEELNKPGALPPVRMEAEEEIQVSQPMTVEAATAVTDAAEEMVTIKRQFEFAGEIHTEEKIVPKSSAEAQLWLAQQAVKSTTAGKVADGKSRPLRKISRFDPNYANLEAFRNHSIRAQPDVFKGPKLNVVEKSKMDWAVHVDAEGLKDELNVAAKAKDAYLSRMDFLGQVEQRKDDEARAARQKG